MCHMAHRGAKGLRNWAGCWETNFFLSQSRCSPKHKIYLDMMVKIVAILALAAGATAAAAPEPNIWVRIDKIYTSERGHDVVLLKDTSHKISGTAYGPTDAVDVWLDGRLVAHAAVIGAKGNMSAWPVWQAVLPPMPAGFGHTVSVTANSTSRSSYNATTGVNFGTVLLCSGEYRSLAFSYMIIPLHDQGNPTWL